MPTANRYVDVQQVCDHGHQDHHGLRERRGYQGEHTNHSNELIETSWGDKSLDSSRQESRQQNT